MRPGGKSQKSFYKKMITESISVFNVCILFLSCLLAVAFAPTRYNVTSTLLVSLFLITMGIDSVLFKYQDIYPVSVYFFAIKITVQAAFTMIFIYISAWPLVFVSASIIGIFSYSVAAALHGTVTPYYNEAMMILSVSLIAAMLLGVFCVVRSFASSARGSVTHKSSAGYHK